MHIIELLLSGAFALLSLILFIVGLAYYHDTGVLCFILGAACIYVSFRFMP
jgi:hypothetical protein